jgi:hypothetical protein
MTNFEKVLQQLRAEQKQAQAAAESLGKAISAIQGLNARSAGNTTNGKRPKRAMSAAARRRIAAAQRARWAKFRKPSSAANARTSKPGSHRISAAGRKRIAAAARARWARVRAQQTKKAA